MNKGRGNSPALPYIALNRNGSNKAPARWKQESPSGISTKVQQNTSPSVPTTNAQGRPITRRNTSRKAPPTRWKHNKHANNTMNNESIKINVIILFLPFHFADSKRLYNSTAYQ